MLHNVGHNTVEFSLILQSFMSVIKVYETLFLFL